MSAAYNIEMETSTGVGCMATTTLQQALTIPAEVQNLFLPNNLSIPLLLMWHLPHKLGNKSLSEEEWLKTLLQGAPTVVSF
jgi:hypothetical protein